jgi:ribosomal protein L11 methyltransferase
VRNDHVGYPFRMSTEVQLQTAASSSGWQLCLRNVEAGADELIDLLGARGARVTFSQTDGLVATFSGAPELILMDALGAWLENLGLDEAVLFTRLADTDPWLESWRAVFVSTRVSDRLSIRPVWESPVEGRRDIILDPTTAFGGGFHPTTAACLEMLDRSLAHLQRDLAEPTVLDLGAGTGILALAAAHLGGRVVGVEIDGPACESARRNAALNGVSDRITIIHDTLRGDHPRYDLVVANVLASVLIALAPAITEVTGRDLILSGIQESKEAVTRAAYPGLVLVDRVLDRGWVTLWLRHS